MFSSHNKYIWHRKTTHKTIIQHRSTSSINPTCRSKVLQFIYEIKRQKQSISVPSTKSQTYPLRASLWVRLSKTRSNKTSSPGFQFSSCTGWKKKIKQSKELHSGFLSLSSAQQLKCRKAKTKLRSGFSNAMHKHGRQGSAFPTSHRQCMPAATVNSSKTLNSIEFAQLEALWHQGLHLLVQSWIISVRESQQSSHQWVLSQS